MRKSKYQKDVERKKAAREGKYKTVERVEAEIRKLSDQLAPGGLYGDVTNPKERDLVLTALFNLRRVRNRHASV